MSEEIKNLNRQTAKEELLTGAKPQQDFWHKLIDSLVFKNDDLKDFLSDTATKEEAIKGLDQKKVMTAWTVKAAIDNFYDSLKDGVPEDGDTLKKLRGLIHSLEVWQKALSTEDADNIINTFKEVQAAFEGIPEGARKVLELLGAKAEKVHEHTPEQVGLGNLPNVKSDAIDSNSADSLATSKAVYNARNWANIKNKPSRFNPSVHSHYWSSITNKPTIPVMPTWYKNEESLLNVVCAGQITASGARVDYWGISYSAAKVGLGHYRITHNANLSYYGLLVSSFKGSKSNTHVFEVTNRAKNYFDVQHVNHASPGSWDYARSGLGDEVAFFFLMFKLK